MARHNGKPSGANESEGTGVPSNLSPDKLKENLETTDKYTEDDEQIAQNVHVRHPNRNTNKSDATNVGGYKQ